MTDRVDKRLLVGDRVRIRRLGTTDDWVVAFVAVASNKNPQSVGLLLGDGLPERHGIYTNGVPLIIDYEQQTVRSLFGAEYEIEVEEKVI